MLSGTQIILRPLCLDDASDTYVAWMNDYSIVKYTESRYMLHTKESLRQFIETCQNSASDYAFAIVAKENQTHIGNIKLGNINWHHRYGDIGLIVGIPQFHGRGIGTEAIELVCEYGFKILGLHRVISGAYECNKGSIRAFEKNGFKQYGRSSEASFFEGKYIDSILMEKLNPYEER